MSLHFRFVVVPCWYALRVSVDPSGPVPVRGLPLCLPEQLYGEGLGVGLFVSWVCRHSYNRCKERHSYDWFSAAMIRGPTVYHTGAVGHHRWVLEVYLLGIYVHLQFLQLFKKYRQ